MSQPRAYSLVTRIVLAVVAAQLMCAALLCSAALLHERHTRLRALDTRIEGRSDSLLGAVQDAEDPEDNVSIDSNELRLPSDDVYAVYNRGSRLLGTSPNAPSNLIQRQADGFRELRVGHTRFRVLQREAMRIIDRPENGGVGLRRPITILYASPEGHLWHEIFEAARFYVFAILGATALTTLLVALLLRRSLQPLGALAASAARISPPALMFQAPDSALRVRELRPLTEVLNDSVARVRDAFAKEQRFLGDAAHELKTAIAVVRSSVQLLLMRRRTEDEYVTGLKRLLADNSRVEALVAQMLQLSRAEETGPEGAEIDLRQVASAVVEQLAPIYKSAGVPVQLSGSSLPALLRLPPDRAFTLISNLVLNAIQHTMNGEPVLVTVSRVSPASVVLEVIDRGLGISPEALPHIFERFYREDRSRSRDTGGTGLGLSICKSIVEAAQGSIAVESAAAAGTRVIVTFSAA